MVSRVRVLAVVALILLAGCAGLGGSGDAGGAQGGGDGAQMSGGDGGSSQPVEADQGAGAGDAENIQAGDAAADRAIIRNGRMVVEVENYSTTADAIAARARTSGGYVSDSNRELHRDDGETWYTGYIVVRVPSKEYEPTQSMVAEQGTVRSEETTTKDVTDKLVDLEARLTNLRERRDRLRTFYDRANSTEELLRIEEELSSVQSDIERLEAQKRSLEQRVAYSTLRVEIHEPAPEPSAQQVPYHERSLVAAFLSSVTDVYVFTRGLLVTAASLAPWLVVLAVPVVGGRRLLRSRSLPLLGQRGGSESTTADDDNSGDDPQQEPTAEPTEESPDDDA
ncbi:hypothetical protein AMS69_11070 [Haloarcula rubripromontorii]|uniref:DUF4349 domain-containing protein n=1 Tax=Haloarcula rubripromontorii TaxID=1705562 RepID=A0A0N0U972_9EURY|nr:DUF4349 domain-containing protein [Haloarcula rubripromontorii]KOX92984.1 hypothetical protein AMS69_11070 [Haloarcula rubripromontorii]NLV06671.1 DUF4349 domain-containing protein [Haloarcula rubripromontorii]